MPQKNAQDRLWKILTPVLLVLAVLAMAKTLFVGLEIDEEYAFSLGFRLVKGDRLFYTMWEPHQLSALPAALVLAEPDEILTLGALVAEHVFDVQLPVLCIGHAAFADLAAHAGAVTCIDGVADNVIIRSRTLLSG
mgnify:CR=1 FL=1